jgi:hypothetical protein
MMVSGMNEMDNSADRESPLKVKQDEIIKECDRLINHFSNKAHESKRNFRLFRACQNFCVHKLSDTLTLDATPSSRQEPPMRFDANPYFRKLYTCAPIPMWSLLSG